MGGGGGFGNWDTICSVEQTVEHQGSRAKEMLWEKSTFSCFPAPPTSSILLRPKTGEEFNFYHQASYWDLASKGSKHDN